MRHPRILWLAASLGRLHDIKRDLDIVIATLDGLGYHGVDKHLQEANYHISEAIKAIHADVEKHRWMNEGVEIADEIAEVLFPKKARKAEVAEG